MDDYYYLDELFLPEKMDYRMLAVVLCVSPQTAERLISRKICANTSTSVCFSRINMQKYL